MITIDYTADLGISYCTAYSKVVVVVVDRRDEKTRQCMTANGIIDGEIQGTSQKRRTNAKTKGRCWVSSNLYGVY